jgi:hypothetical protein
MKFISIQAETNKPIYDLGFVNITELICKKSYSKPVRLRKPDIGWIAFFVHLTCPSSFGRLVVKSRGPDKIDPRKSHCPDPLKRVFPSFLNERRKLMIQIIGLMIGSYSIVRMISLGSRKGTYGETTFVRILCGLNILLTCVLILLLLASGFEMPRMPR